MAIIDTLTKSAFIQRFREIRPDNFSYAGLKALYDYLEELSESMDTPIEFDPIGLCCEYVEYSNFDELKSDYDSIEDMDDLTDHTTVIMIDDESFIIQQF